jgi:hypothetical protein
MEKTTGKNFQAMKFATDELTDPSSFAMEAALAIWLSTSFWSDNSPANPLGYEMQASRTYRFIEKR